MVLRCGYVYDRYKQNKCLKRNMTFIKKRKSSRYIEATFCMKIGMYLQHFACRVKKGCFKNTQNFNTIARLHLY